MNLNDCRNCFGLTYLQFLTEYNISDLQIHEHLRYEKIVDVTRIDLAVNQFFFFKNDKLRIIYISDDVLAKEIWNEFRSHNNSTPPGETVRSRAGKTSNQLIFAGDGVTVSLNRETVDFIELYAPCTTPEYLQGVYREPAPFIR